MFWTQLTDELLSIGQPDEAHRLLEQAPPEDRDPNLSWLLDELTIKKEISIVPITIAREAVQSDDKLIDAWIDLGRLALGRNLPADAVVALNGPPRLTRKPMYPLTTSPRPIAALAKTTLRTATAPKPSGCGLSHQRSFAGRGRPTSLEPPARSALEQVP